MTTKILEATEQNLLTAAELIKKGEVVGMPTETVYGLAANALDPLAVKKIFEAKGRPMDNPLIVHVSDTEMIRPLVKEIPPLAQELAKRFWPGPLTIIMPKSDLVPMETSGGLDTVGIRFPSHKAARELIRLSGVPIAAPSANLSGSPSPTTAQHVFDDMNGRIPLIIDGAACAVGVESSVLLLNGDSITVLRPGMISVEELLEITDNVKVDKGALEMVSNAEKVMSPGMKYKHYSPKADVVILSGSTQSYRRYVSEHTADGVMCMPFEKSDVPDGVKCIPFGKSGEEQAHLLFDCLREFDKLGAKTVYARCPSRNGAGLAVYNRLLRAAGFKIIFL